MDLPSVKETLHLARQAAIALVGVGSIQTAGSSYYDLHPDSTADRETLIRSGVVAEFLAHLINETGGIADYSLNSRLVALAPGELSNCRKVIGVAAGSDKVLPIRAVLNGSFLDSLVVDEETASQVLRAMEGQSHVARRGHAPHRNLRDQGPSGRVGDLGHRRLDVGRNRRSPIRRRHPCRD
jgi:DNA-binding transcriptional regulator LsrR (DeoR family)